MPDFSLSVSDLSLIPAFVKAAKDDDKEALNKILFDNGMDVSKPYEYVRRVHRNLQNKIVDTYRFESVERLDPAWIKSGAASQEAIIQSTGDVEMIKDLARMNRQRTQDRSCDDYNSKDFDRD